jgi:hypothetical protein
VINNEVLPCLVTWTFVVDSGKSVSKNQTLKKSFPIISLVSPGYHMTFDIPSVQGFRNRDDYDPCQRKTKWLWPRQMKMEVENQVPMARTDDDGG